jgi:hypothetical protein
VPGEGKASYGLSQRERRFLIVREVDGEKFRFLEKKLTNSDPFMKSTHIHSLSLHTRVALGGGLAAHTVHSVQPQAFSRCTRSHTTALVTI